MVFPAHSTKGLNLAQSEFLATLEMLATLALTGNKVGTYPRMWKTMGVQQALDNWGLPFFDPKVLDTKAWTLRAADWPTDEVGRLQLSHVRAICYHYGTEVALGRSSRLLFDQLLKTRPLLQKNEDLQKMALLTLVSSLWVPEMRDWVAARLRVKARKLLKEARSAQQVLGEDDEIEDIEDVATARRAAIEVWAKSTQPFAKTTFQDLLENVLGQDRPVSTKTREAFAQELWSDITAGIQPGLAAKGASWPGLFRIFQKRYNSLSGARFMTMLSECLSICSVDRLPGSTGRSVSVHLILHLIPRAPPATALGPRSSWTPTLGFAGRRTPADNALQVRNQEASSSGRSHSYAILTPVSPSQGNCSTHVLPNGANTRRPRDRCADNPSSTENPKGFSGYLSLQQVPK